MNLLRLLLLIAIVWLIYRLIKRWIAQSNASHTAKKPRAIENMVRCNVCGLHIPQNEALSNGEAFYCSRAHLDQDKPGG